MNFHISTAYFSTDPRARFRQGERMNKRLAILFAGCLVASAQSGNAVDQIIDERSAQNPETPETDAPPYVETQAIGRILAVERTSDGFDIAVTGETGAEETYTVAAETPVRGRSSVHELQNGDRVRFIFNLGRVVEIVVEE